MGLADLGWSEFFARHFAALDAGLVPGRIIAQERLLYLAHDGETELTAEISGRYYHEAERGGRFPTVGDWVAVKPFDPGRATIHALLPRQTSFSRKVPGGRTVEQVIAANIDTVFLVAGLDQEFNLRRIERYVATALGSGANPVIVLNKADLCPDPAGAGARLGTIAAGLAVLPVSASTGAGLDALRSYLKPGETVAFVGSSGVGKSTIINRLLGTDRQATGEISDAVGKGRHTTTRRELIPMPGGGLLMDTPGLRELYLWGSEESLAPAFEDVERFARQCRFRDCTHDDEPGCAVRAAVEAGDLEPERLRNYEKLQRELRFLAKRQRWAGMKKHQPRPRTAESALDE